MSKSRRMPRPRALPQLPPEQVAYWRQYLDTMIFRSITVSETRVRPRRELEGSEAAEVLDLLHRYGLVHRWAAELPREVYYVPTYAGCIFTGLSGKAAMTAWRHWLLTHPQDTPGWDLQRKELIVIRDRPESDRITPESKDLMLLEFLANLCHYSQTSPHMSGAGSVADEDYLMDLVSYQVACFLANYTVEGGHGVESDIVLSELTGPRRSLQWWRIRLRRLAKSYGGWKATELGTLNYR